MLALAAVAASVDAKAIVTKPSTTAAAARITSSSTAASITGPTFTKTISYIYSSHTNSVASCPTDIYYNAAQTCPPGCNLDKLVFGSVATTPYACQPTAAPTSYEAYPVVAHMSCVTTAGQFTTKVTPMYGAYWTTCATSTGTTHAYAIATTLSVTTVYS